MDVVSGSNIEVTMPGTQILSVSGQAVVYPADNMTFPQLTGVIVFVIAIVVGCLLADAIFRRY